MITKGQLVTEARNFDIGDKWALHNLIKQAVEAVESQSINLDNQLEILIIVFERFGWVYNPTQRIR